MAGIKIKGSIGRIIITLMILSITIIGGTFAWFTYRSRESALVLSIISGAKYYMMAKDYITDK